MSFPQTRLTLIERLATGGSEEDWQCFLQEVNVAAELAELKQRLRK